ncbi:hypothetical protein GF336_01295 [Candidatus Woesearchaeota archaeon]|nr:hypothetical protein [Candidatus Woesearchaeota archaeon]
MKKDVKGLLLMMAALAGIGWGAMYFRPKTEESAAKIEESQQRLEQKVEEKTRFENACIDKSIREMYISDIAEKINPPKHTKIEYASKKRIKNILEYNKNVLKQDVKMNLHTNAITVPNAKDIEEYFAKKLNPLILVFDWAFEGDMIKNEHDLVSCLKQEIDHAEFYYKGDERINPEELRSYLKQNLAKDPNPNNSVVNVFMELRAIDKQLKEFNKDTDKYSQTYKNHIINYYYDNYAELWKHDENPLSDKLKIRFFRKWMFDHGIAKQDNDRIYLIPPEADKFKEFEGKKLYLPDSIKTK